METAKRWTELEKEKLSYLWLNSDKTAKELAGDLDRTYRSIEWQCANLRLKRPFAIRSKIATDNATLWSIDERNELIRLFTTTSCLITDIAKKLNRSKDSIEGEICFLGLKRPRKIKSNILSNNAKKYMCNDNFFDKIDNPIKAYWLGFIYADGSVNEKYLSIGLSNKDKSHLEKFNMAISSTYIIKHYLSSVKLTICNNKIIKDLHRLGVIQNKTYLSKKIPTLKNPKLMWHLIRGYFDGDGCFACSYPHGWLQLHISFTAKNKTVLESLQKFIENKINIKSNIGRDKESFLLRYGKKSYVISLIKALYENSNEEILLNRKLTKINKILNKEV